MAQEEDAMFTLSTKTPRRDGPEEIGDPSWGLFWAQVKHILRWLVTTTDGVKNVVRSGILLLMGLILSFAFGVSSALQERECIHFND